MVVSIPRVAAGEEASAIVTFEIAKCPIEKPDESTGLSLPANCAKDFTKYLPPEPLHRKHRPEDQAACTDDHQGEGRSRGRRSRRSSITSRRTSNTSFPRTFIPPWRPQSGQGGLRGTDVSLFIAFCRANKIPARAVWVPDHCYPEFYLQDSQGQGTWFPCQIAGDGHIFGEMDEERPILQKGDNFKVPEEKGPQRYVKQFFKAANAEANPEVRFVLERVEE